MAATTKTWTNNQAPQCEDVDLNGFKNENNNAIVAAGLILSTSDNQQTGQAMTIHTSGSDFYTSTGTNTYILTPAAVGVGFNGPSIYFNGMRVRTLIENSNTGSSTIDVDGLGAKSVFNGGLELSSGTMSGNVEFVFDSANDRFNLVRTGDSVGTVGIDTLLGLEITASSGTSTTIGAGVARSAGNTTSLSLSAASQKSFTAPWATAFGNSAGVPTGVLNSLALFDTVHFFIFTDTNRVLVEGGWDTDINAANLLSAATSATSRAYNANDIRRIHSSTIESIGPPALRPMRQIGDEFTILPFAQDGSDGTDDMQGFATQTYATFEMVAFPALGKDFVVVVTALWGTGITDISNQNLQCSLESEGSGGVLQDLIGTIQDSANDASSGAAGPSQIFCGGNRSTQFKTNSIGGAPTTPNVAFLFQEGWFDRRSTF